MSKNNIRWLLITLLSGLSILIASWLAGIENASGQNAPGDYDLRFDVTIHNNTNDTFSGLVPFLIDSNTLLTTGYINSEGSNVLFADSSDAVVRGMVEDVATSTAYWWIETEATPGQTAQERVYISGPVEEKYFPADARNFTRVERSSTSSLEIDDFLVMTVTAETDTCGTLLGKKNLELNDSAAGYGIYYVGNEDFAVFQGAVQGLSRYIFYDITPTQDLWICGASAGAVLEPNEVNRIRIENASTTDIVLDTVPVYIPETEGTEIGSVLLFRDIALLEEGQLYTLYIDGDTSLTFTRQVIFGGGSPGLMHATGTVAIYDQPSSSVSFDGNTYRAPGFQTDDTFSGTGLPGAYYPGILFVSPTNTAGELEFAINCNVVDVDWNGARGEFQTFYNTSSGNMTIVANGFTFPFPFPSCQTFGNKSGAEDLTTLALADYLNPGSERLGGTLFIPPVPGDLEAINAKIRWDRGGNGTDAPMNSVLHAALYDSSQNLIAQTNPLAITLPDPTEVNRVNYKMDFSSPPSIATSSDYYMMIWADNITEGTPAFLSSFNGGPNTDNPSDFEFATGWGNQAAAISAKKLRYCSVNEADLTGFSGEIVFLENIRIHTGNIVTGSGAISAGLYFHNGSEWELLESGSTSAVSNEFAVINFSGTTQLDPSNEDYIIVLVSPDDDTGNNTKFISRYDPAIDNISCDPLYDGVDVNNPHPDWPSIPATLSGAFAFTAPDNTYDEGGDPGPPYSTGQLTGSVTEYNIGIQVRRIVQQTEIHLTTADLTGGSIVYDNEAYDASFPDPFTTDSTTANKIAAIWGDVIPSTTDLIATSTDAVIIGAGLTGKVDDVSISEVGPRLHYTFQGDEIFNTQIGNAGNSWEWLGTVTDDSGFFNNGTYHIISNLTGITVTVLPLGASAVAVPIPTRTFPNIYGTPDVVSPLTPIPTVQPSTIMTPIKAAIEGNDLQEETAYIFIVTFVLALISSVIMKGIPFDFVPWIIGIIGFSILSQVAGPFFLVMWVILFGLWATGLWLTLRFAR